MKKVLVYTMKYCPYCENTKRFLKAKSVPFEEVMVADDDEAEWDRLEKLTGFKTMPQIFVETKFIGGYRELMELDKSGKLDEILA